MEKSLSSLCFVSKIVVLSALVLSAVVGIEGASSCSPRSMAVYKLIVRTFWTRDLFPKHYPDWRPSAQWSKVVGQSHNKSFVLFHVGEIASQGVKTFAETGRSDWFDEHRQGEGGLHDQFTAPPIKTGAGRSEVDFFVNGNHSFVSLMARIVPSPDWFIGIDSVDLCVDGNWIETVTIEGEPLDAGTDNGFTFTAPNWATEPQGVIYHLTSSYPSHPAGSFFYPNLKRLPPIAAFQFIKIKEYELSEIVHRPVNTSSRWNGYEILHKQQPRKNAVKSTHADDHETEAKEVLAEKGRDLSSMLTTENTLMENVTTKSTPVPVTTSDSDMPTLPRGDKRAIMNSIVEKYRRQGNGAVGNWSHQSGLVSTGNATVGKPAVHRGGLSIGQDRVRKQGKQRTRKHRPVRDCQLSNWGEWSACSKSCGIGEMQRRRQVVKHARHGGRGCPILTEIRWCGSANPCNKNYFQW